METMPGLEYVALVPVPGPLIRVALDRSVNLPGPHFLTYKVSLRRAVGD